MYLFLRVVPRAVTAFLDNPGRATTRRAGAVCADCGVIVPLRAIFVFVLRFVVLDAVRLAGAGRGTTRRPGDNFVVLTTVLIGFNDCDVVTPGFKLVRI